MFRVVTMLVKKNVLTGIDFETLVSSTVRQMCEVGSAPERTCQFFVAMLFKVVNRLLRNKQLLFT